MLDETDQLYLNLEKVVYSVNAVPAYGKAVGTAVGHLMAMTDSVARAVSKVVDVPTKFLELIEKFLGEPCPGRLAHPSNSIYPGPPTPCPCP